MKKVAILTRRYGENFGSSFQAFALQYTIDKMEVKSVVLDYDELYHNIRWQIKPLIYDILYLLCKTGLLNFFSKELTQKVFNRQKQKEKFKIFDGYLVKTSKKLKTEHDLSMAAEGYDCCICGSDQIWSPFLFDKNYYLPFINKKQTKKISYAASLGIYDKSLLTNKMISFISDFDYISVREANAVDLLNSAGIKKKIEFVLDPTLLVSKAEWETLESDYHVNGKYILCYFLGKNIPNCFIRKLKDLTGLQVVNIQMFYNINQLNADKELFDIGPADFLKLLSGAEYVCTDSYHGMLMSYNYEKSFFIFNRFTSSDYNNQNSRVDSILKHMNLEHRRVNDSSDVENIDLPIHYPIENSINKKIEESLSFLKRTILS